MKVIIYVDYSSSKFIEDFKISNKLLEKHQVLLVINNEQLFSSLEYYDLLLIGNSIKNISAFDQNIPIIDINIPCFAPIAAIIEAIVYPKQNPLYPIIP